ncbi:hypothetical protein [Deinococcus budaensis]|uniref:FtsH-binding integral membrane protein n=1 Tax=Deinococcus budaensis TaxID=1665626 RepID=A0A7W8LQ14_9DEIO|nr:hypothetical protein [Deinococcus budaensis]MBB5234172.1 FtsH-binding integral membrane protein [Deinococcus budaensis]
MLITGLRRPAPIKGRVRLLLPAVALAFLAFIQPILVPLALLVLFAVTVPVGTEVQSVVAVFGLGLLALFAGSAVSLATGSLCTVTTVSTLAFLGTAIVVLWRTHKR